MHRCQFNGHSEKVEDRSRDQIEYTREEPWVKEMFIEELAKQGLKNLMPDEIYTNPDYVWGYDTAEESGADIYASGDR